MTANRRHIAPELKKKMVELAIKHKHAEIARRLGVDRKTVSRIVNLAMQTGEIVRKPARRYLPNREAPLDDAVIDGAFELGFVVLQYLKLGDQYACGHLALATLIVPRLAMNLNNDVDETWLSGSGIAIVLLSQSYPGLSPSKLLS
ncbi:hypothetical protein FIBSPDRAFT_928525 [Athelia psychrophila]|uniref:Uncharacterized protein n=1 Tax=Athelia psychrophila TaxID=1759441 RepID=A0A166PXS7_9AGAM|nr:hypothetical protein FIBSPDRAFT_928525 [Fibularhizoctonia sp. CBS 109695]